MNIADKCSRKSRNAKGTITNLYTKLQMKIHNIPYGNNNVVHGHIDLYNEGVIQIGSCNRINSAYWANPIGVGDRTSFKVGRYGKLIIKNNCAISNTAFVCTTSIVIEDFVMIGSGCRIWDTDFHSINPEMRSKGDSCSTKKGEIHIKERAFIGAGSFILKGVTIGREAVIGAGSVVTHDVPDGEIWAGVPAKYIRDISKGEV